MSDSAFVQLHEMVCRGLLDDASSLYRTYQRSLAGWQGELKVAAALKDCLPIGVDVQQGVNYSRFGDCQVDLLVVWGDWVWVIEVKHYSGPFEYRDQCCYLYQKPMNENQIASMEKRLSIMRTILDELGSSYRLHGTMVFSHDHAQIYVPRQQHFDLLPASLLKSRVNLLEKQLNLKVNRRHQQAILSHLKHYEYVYPARLQKLTAQDWTRLRKGIRCLKCGGFEMGFTNKKCKCHSCGKTLSKKEAIFHTLDQYYALIGGFTKSEHCNINEFIGNQISRATLYRALKEYRIKRSV